MENLFNAKIKEEVAYAIAHNHGRVEGQVTEYFGFSSNGMIDIRFYYNPDTYIGSYFPKKR